MRYHALACDYDGTIATHGHVDDSTIAALLELKKSGRKLVLVTGRELDDLSILFIKKRQFAHPLSLTIFETRNQITGLFGQIFLLRYGFKNNRAAVINKLAGNN